MDSYLEGKTALVVDSNRDDLSNLRGLLGQLGLASVAAATSANMAVSYLAAQSFDFCFVAYDLGLQAKNGLQVIQEATLDGSRRYRDCFVLIAGAEQAQVLAGALEYAPDACLAKPFDMQRLRQCLDRLGQVKTLLLPLEECLDQRNWQGALERGEQAQAQYPGVRPYLQRLRGIALLHLQRYREAEALFAELAQERVCDWADIGQGVALYHQGRYREARECLAHLTGQNQTVSEAFLMQARCERVLGRWQEAQMLLRKATILQPAMPQLQADLACLLALSGDWSQAATAYRGAVVHGRHSPFQRVDCYYGLVESLLQQVEQGVSPSSAAAEAECVRTLESAVRDFDGEPAVIFRSRLLAARLYRRSGNTAMAEQAARYAFERFAQLTVSEQAELADLLVDGLDSSSLAEAAQQKRQEAMRALVSLDWGRSNLAAMLSYRKKEYEKAYDGFCEAERLRGGNPGVMLNLVQAGLEVARHQSPRAPDILRHCDELLYGSQIGALSQRQQERYRSLCQRLGDLNRARRGGGAETAV
ncbi:MAG: tetratricopeptide repeat protein [Oceanospirillaceae bacterium]|nr:tetratricopeptide repeat protein [Oceanospirillaceae bacterium]